MIVVCDDMRDRSIEEGECTHKHDPIVDWQVAIEVDLEVGFVSKTVGVLNIRNCVSNGVLDQPLDTTATATVSVSSVVSSSVNLEWITAWPHGTMGNKSPQDTGISITNLIIREALAAE